MAVVLRVLLSLKVDKSRKVRGINACQDWRGVRQMLNGVVYRCGASVDWSFFTSCEMCTVVAHENRRVTRHIHYCMMLMFSVVPDGYGYLTSSLTAHDASRKRRVCMYQFLARKAIAVCS